jgi:drug/metabolite transporter (DMT)-like permease
VSEVNVRGLAHLLVVYIVWGSTYLAIRIAVREGSGFPPFYMAGTRILIASGILFLLCLARGKSLKPTRQDVQVFAASCPGRRCAPRPATPPSSSAHSPCGRCSWNR